MPTLYYGHNMIIKKEMLILDIISFYIVIIASQYSFYYLINIDEVNFILKYLSCVGIFILFGGYMIHTLMPAKSIIFKDPISNKYGFKGHTEMNHKK